MAVLGPAKKAMLRRLLAWDRARVSQAISDGFDCTLYAARQDLADASIDTDPDTWTTEVRFLFMAVMEITRTPTKARAINIGRVAAVVTRWTLAERLLLRALADDLGIRGRLREVAPRQWGDNDVEGD